MKKMMFLVASILAISLFGCANSAPEEEVDESEAIEIVQETEKVEEKVLKTKFEINGDVRDIGDYSKTEEEFLKKFEEKHGISDYELYDASELTEQMLINRDGTTIIERCIGMVTNKRGDGALLNYTSPEYYYISYRTHLEEIHEGAIVLSYMVYNPESDYIDDIIERYDFVICREFED